MKWSKRKKNFYSRKKRIKEKQRDSFFEESPLEIQKSMNLNCNKIETIMLLEKLIDERFEEQAEEIY